MRTDECPPEETLLEYLRGSMSDGDVALLEQHVSDCPSCLDRALSLQAADLPAAVHLAGRGPQGLDDISEHDIADLKERLKSLPFVHSTRDTTSVADDASRDETSNKVGDMSFDFLAPPQQPGELGRLGGYRVLAILGKGGMGVVFQAEDLQLKRPVALKVMLPRLAADPVARERFLREAQAAAAVRHDNVVTIHQAGEVGPVAYLAMEFLEGQSLEDRLRGQAALPPNEVRDIGRQIAEGLAAAHQRGLIHRDVKPANIWLEASPGRMASPGRKSGEFRVKLLDFGLARPVEDDSHLTSAKTVIGTPAYMSPEQANADPVDVRSDLFSLGCVLYRLSTGQPAFAGGKSLQIMRAIVHDDPIPPRQLNPDVPADLSDLVMRLLAKDPAQRPESAQAVADALKILESPPAPVSMPDSSIHSRIRENAGESGPTRSRIRQNAGESRKLRLAFALALLLLVGAALAVYQIIFSTPHGTFIVKIDSKDVEARFMNGKLELLGADGKLKYTLTSSEANKTLPAGPYKIRVVGADGLTVDVPEFVMKKGDNITVHVVLKARAVARNDPDAKKVSLEPSKPAISLRLLVVSKRTGNAQIYLLDGGNEAINLTNSKTEDSAPACSPDGKKIAFCSNRDGAINIYVMDADGKNVAQLTKGITATCFPSWSPDGKKIVFSRYSGKTNLICIMDSDGGNVKQVGVGSDPALSPDGNKILFASLSNGKGFRVNVMDADGANVKQLTTSENIYGWVYPAWSPDGKKIAWADQVNSSLEIFVADSDGKNAKQLSDLGATNTFPVWSPDGKEIVFYHSTSGGAGMIFIMDANGANLRRVLREEAMMEFRPAWRPTAVEPSTIEAGWQSLLPGKELAGWWQHGVDDGLWRVEEGVLSFLPRPKQLGAPSILFTDDKSFDNFHLKMDFKVGKGKFAFLKFRAVELAKNAPSMKHFGEITVVMGETPHNCTAAIDMPGRKIRNGTENLYVPGTWATLDLFADGYEILVKVNGTTTSEWHDNKGRQGYSSKGHLALLIQQRESSAQFRNIQIKRLPATTAP